MEKDCELCDGLNKATTTIYMSMVFGYHAAWIATEKNWKITSANKNAHSAKWTHYKKSIYTILSQIGRKYTCKLNPSKKKNHSAFKMTAH